MTTAAQRAGALNLGQGLCRVPPPAYLLECALSRIQAGPHTYGPAEGQPEFRRAIAEKLADYSKLFVDPDSEVVVCPGATGALTATLTALLNDGDEVLLFEPFYGYHRTACLMQDLVPLSVPCTSDLRPDLSALASVTTERTRAIILCTPGNPSGIRLSLEEIQVIARLAEMHDLLVICDEIYEHIYFVDEPHLSPATVGGLGSRTITISGLSKTFSIPGWRLGYAVGSERLMQKVRLAADALFVCPPVPLQEIAAEALRLPGEYYVELRSMYKQKLKHLAVSFQGAGIETLQPDGAYYLLCRFDGRFSSGTEAAGWLLDFRKVACIPGEAFFMGEPPFPFVRACFSIPDEELEQARLLLS